MITTTDFLQVEVFIYYDCMTLY